MCFRFEFGSAAAAVGPMSKPVSKASLASRTSEMATKKMTPEVSRARLQNKSLQLLLYTEGGVAAGLVRERPVET